MDKDRPTSLVALRDARERTIATLSDAFARDDLDMDDFEQRLGIAHRTDSLDGAVTAWLAAIERRVDRGS